MPIIQHRDEPCHNCGGTFKPAPQPTAEMRRAAADKENPIFINPRFDTAPQRVVDELGGLWVCDGCGIGMRGMPAKADAGQEFRAPRPA